MVTAAPITDIMVAAIPTMGPIATMGTDVADITLPTAAGSIPDAVLAMATCIANGTPVWRDATNRFER
jgi:hypothetical protein